MIIIQDKQEKKPLEFSRNVTAIEIKHIKGMALEGDYCCRFDDGHISPHCFERKSLADLFGTMRGGLKKFKAETERAKENGLHLILIVEAPFSKVRETILHKGRSIKPDRTHRIKRKQDIAWGTQIARTVFTYVVKERLDIVFCKDRADMARYIEEYFFASERAYNSENK